MYRSVYVKQVLSHFDETLLIQYSSQAVHLTQTFAHIIRTAGFPNHIIRLYFIQIHIKQKYTYFIKCIGNVKTTE